MIGALSAGGSRQGLSLPVPAVTGSSADYVHPRLGGGWVELSRYLEAALFVFFPGTARARRVAPYRGFALAHLFNDPCPMACPWCTSWRDAMNDKFHERRHTYYVEERKSRTDFSINRCANKVTYDTTARTGCLDKNEASRARRGCVRRGRCGASRRSAGSRLPSRALKVRWALGVGAQRRGPLPWS